MKVSEAKSLVRGDTVLVYLGPSSKKAIATRVTVTSIEQTSKYKVAIDAEWFQGGLRKTQVFNHTRVYLPFEEIQKKPERLTNDPTYDKGAINANPVWRIAFIISECLNDKAPIGWGKYIWVAEAIVKDQSREKIIIGL